MTANKHSRKTSAVFLDRDGVINSMVLNPEFGFIDSPANPDQLVLLPGVEEAICELNRMNLLVIVVSNQPGIAKGKFTEEMLSSMTRKVTDLIESAGGKIDGIYNCLHHPDALLPDYRVDCVCRKPEPGLLLEAAGDFDIDLGRSYMIGDGIVDIIAGRAAGTATMFLHDSKCYVCRELERQGIWPDYITSTLPEAVTMIRDLENGERPGYEFSGMCGNLSSADMKGYDVDISYSAQYMTEAVGILNAIDQEPMEQMIELLVHLRERQGRLFFLGVGGGAANASHAVSDFRKIAQIESYSPSDNVAELTARINDDGWDTSYVNWLAGSHLGNDDMVFVLSVGGGDVERGISANLVKALQYAQSVGAKICGVVGRDGGFTAQVADACVVIPVLNQSTVTPHTESFQALIWHLLVSHPRLKTSEMKWESVGNTSPGEEL